MQISARPPILQLPKPVPQRPTQLFPTLMVDSVQQLGAAPVRPRTPPLTFVFKPDELMPMEEKSVTQPIMLKVGYSRLCFNHFLILINCCIKRASIRESTVCFYPYYHCNLIPINHIYLSTVTINQ